MKDNKAYNSVKDDAPLPKFIEDFLTLEEVEMIQADSFMIKPHFEKKELLFCVIDGNMAFKIIHPIFNQEVYAGQKRVWHPERDEPPIDNPPTDVLQPNESPVDFFKPDLRYYPAFDDANVASTILRPGDCMYVPSYSWYQALGQAKASASASIAGSLVLIAKYQGTSSSLDKFMEAIEQKIL